MLKLKILDPSLGVTVLDVLTFKKEEGMMMRLTNKLVKPLRILSKSFSFFDLAQVWTRKRTDSVAQRLQTHTPSFILIVLPTK